MPQRICIGLGTPGPEWKYRSSADSAPNDVAIIMLDSLDGISKSLEGVYVVCCSSCMHRTLIALYLGTRGNVGAITRYRIGFDLQSCGRCSDKKSEMNVASCQLQAPVLIYGPVVVR